MEDRTNPYLEAFWNKKEMLKRIRLDNPLARAHEGTRVKVPLIDINGQRKDYYPPLGYPPLKGLRHNKGKRRWSLVHYKSIEPLVEVLEFGAKKYGEYNWQKGLDKKEILESMMRHLTALMDGEENDKESGLHHIGHIMCNAMFYTYFNNKKIER